MNDRIIPKEVFFDIHGEYESWRKELETLIEKRNLRKPILIIR